MPSKTPNSVAAAPEPRPEIVVPTIQHHPEMVAAAARHAELSRQHADASRDRAALEAEFRIRAGETERDYRAAAMVRGVSDADATARFAQIATLREAEVVLARAVEIAAGEVAAAREIAIRECTAQVNEIHVQTGREVAAAWLEFVALSERHRSFVYRAAAAGIGGSAHPLGDGRGFVPGDYRALHAGDFARRLVAEGLLDHAAAAEKLRGVPL